VSPPRHTTRNASLFARAGQRWMRFENWCFSWFLRAERRVRGLPARVHLRPGAFDRRVFRLFFGTLAALSLVPLIPSRAVRARLLLGFILVLCIVVAVLLVRDAYPRRSR
jgi:hypothetical protein